MKCYIWGAALYGKRAFSYVKDNFEIEGFIDKKAEKEKIKFCEHDVIKPYKAFEILKNKKDICVIIAVRFPSEILQNLQEQSINNKVYIFDARNKDSLLLYEVKNGEICIPEYMDKRYLECDEYFLNYTELDKFEKGKFDKALSILNKHYNQENIFEIGCGSGQFANMLFDNGYKNYTGIDFSKNAIKLAIKANSEHKSNFLTGDVFDFLGKKHDEFSSTIFIAFEVLEHIKKDMELLSVLKNIGGKGVLFSVPSFKSFNHLRTFKDLSEIKKRYDMLNIMEYFSLPASKIDKSKIFHIVYANFDWEV